MRCRSCDSRSWRVKRLFLTGIALLFVWLLAVNHWSWVYTIAFGAMVMVPGLFFSLLLLDLVVDAVPFWSKCAPHRGDG